MFDELFTPREEPMDPTDVAWLRMDSDTNLMMVTSVWILNDRITLTRLRQTVSDRFLIFPRFRKRIVKNLVGASYEDDPAFDIKNHIRPVPAGTVRSVADLQRLTSRLAAEPLDPAHALWRWDLVPRYRGGSAVIFRVHHCYADGIALIQVLLTMTDPAREAVPSKRLRKRKSKSATGLLAQIGGPLEKVAESTLRMSLELWQESMHALRHPVGTLEKAAAGADVIGELVKTAVLPEDTPTRFRGELGGAKHVAWAEPMPLDEIKIVGKALGCTINDVLVSSAAGALRAYLVDKGDDVHGLELRAEVPVNLRPPEEDFGLLGNRFGLVLLELPIGIANPLARLYEVHRRMSALKTSRQAIAAYGMLNVLGRLPAVAENQVIDLFSSKASAVMTNVPGPREPLYFAGAELDQLMFWVPQAGSIGMGVSILSYRGHVQFGLITDEGRVPDPEDIVRRFKPEFEKLLYLTLMDSWQSPTSPEELEYAYRAMAEAPGI